MTHAAPGGGTEAAEHSDAMDGQVGERVKVIRQRFGLSQRELARRAGVTNGTISNIEQGQVSPSVGSLRRITEALSLSLAEFFTVDVDSLGASCFLAADELLEIGTDEVSLRLVGGRSGNAPGVQILHERYAPGADTGADMLSHVGEEGGVVTRGEITITVGSEQRVLGPGDAYYFDSRIPHRFRNLGKVECEVVSAATRASL